MKMRKNLGFVVTELLLTLGIIVTSFSVVGVAAGDIKYALDQTQAESNARVLYNLAQQSITAQRASGYDLYIDSTMKYNPEGYKGNSLKVIRSDGPFADIIGDPGLGGSWIVEYDAVYGIVYGVFWSSGDLNFYTGDKDPDDRYRNADRDTLIEKAKELKYNFAFYGTGELDCTPAIKEPKPVNPTPEEPEPDPDVTEGFCYWEVYNDGTVGYYVFSPRDDQLYHSSKRNDTKVVVGDGYGVVLDDRNDIGKVTISGTKSSNLGAGFTVPIANDKGQEIGVIAAFPVDWMRANWLTNEELTKNNATNRSQYNQPYYWDVNISYNGIRADESWSYCPYYAKTAVTQGNYTALPTETSIRSARQLNALSWMYPSYHNQKWAWDWNATRVIGKSFVQELNIDYYEYDFVTYTGRAFVGQMPIGTDWGRFISNYDGSNLEIRNVKLLKRNKTGSKEFTYAGLFGFVSIGTIQNVHIVGVDDARNYNVIDDADYCGVFAAYVQNETVMNCTVDNYTINYYNPMETNSDLSAASEYKHARIGSFIGYVKTPNVNEPLFGDVKSYIYNCHATNCEINAKNYMDTTTDSRATNRYWSIGGFIGSIADREQSQSYGQQVTIENCSVKSTSINCKSTGNMAYFNIGGFAGAKGWPNVVKCTAIVSGLQSNHMATCYQSWGSQYDSVKAICEISTTE